MADHKNRCSFVWFLYDAVVYLFNLFAPTIAARFSSSQSLLASNGWGALVNAFALPGAFFGGEYRFFILVDMMHQTDEAVLIGLIIDRVEPRQTYALGSVMVAMFGFVIGGMFHTAFHNRRTYTGL